mgnify:CR=1 FL=1
MRYDEIRKIEELSEHILYKYDVKIPITNIEELVEKIGGTIIYKNLKYDHNHIIKTGNESFIIKINNFYFPKDGKISDKMLKRIIANELGHLFLYMGYKVNDKLWKTMPIAENHVLDYNQNVDAQVFGNSLLMPRNEYEKVINKYVKNNIINTEIIADYFQVTLGNAIERGRTIGCF